MKRFTCIFPGLYNYILTKDVGMIPYTLSDKYESTVTTYNNDEYSYLNTVLKSEHFTIDYIENTGNEKRDVIKYLKIYSSNIDILQLYHLRYNLLPYYVFYYRLHNKNGKIFLKLDANNEFIDFLIKRQGFLPSLRRLYVKFLFMFIDLVSIETIRNYEVLKDSKLIKENKLIHLPNGVLESHENIELKEKIILYVGYVEKKNKSVDMLLNAVKDVDLKEWKVIVIGEILEDMKEFLEEYFLENPDLKDKIILKGYISDKKALNKEYAKSSIYCCTSKKESFGISTLEAAYHGNYIISTNVGGSPDILNESKYGILIKHDPDVLKENIQHTINNWNSIKQDPTTIQKRVYNKFSWIYLCNNIIEKID